MKKVVYVTGCLGFIGYHVTKKCLDAGYYVFGIDKKTYASNLNFLPELEKSLKFKFLESDINDIERIHDCDYVINTPAETHVDNSIKEPKNVILNNVTSTINLLEWSRTLPNLKIFFYFSTDEVFGPALETKLYKEWDRHRPTNPYSASKSAAENICISYQNTYNIPLMIVNVMNAFGERQHVEKFIPLCIKKILNNELIQIHSYPDKKTSGSRFYIHSQNIANAVLFLIKNGKIGEKYNISGEKEVTNLELAQLIAKCIGKELNYELIDFHSSRPGHDLRYGLDGSKIYELGWNPTFNFEKSLEKVVKWTLENQEWLEEI
jgi:dTDP-glucose 4,6-dehydratase